MYLREIVGQSLNNVYVVRVNTHIYICVYVLVYMCVFVSNPGPLHARPVAYCGAPSLSLRDHNFSHSSHAAWDSHTPASHSATATKAPSCLH